ncbi:hypothetical protein CY34DRAFT_437715 [Suillus luteus UH-Slu-Lm8-n1]|uniref:Uncharacterized protein n=1 Tax=Suillus luteus UH-Slu-Lm8-n1 TaxID=930992 RepID=A0A0D0B528_9AGAM|nr:hypothetical protein CY34DRAFT_437715 [Suillus luteus UH-Slu-Lm8-n1]
MPGECLRRSSSRPSVSYVGTTVVNARVCLSFQNSRLWHRHEHPDPTDGRVKKKRSELVDSGTSRLLSGC